jgi:hypothetical protein
MPLGPPSKGEADIGGKKNVGILKKLPYRRIVILLKETSSPSALGGRGIKGEDKKKN